MCPLPLLLPTTFFVFCWFKKQKGITFKICWFLLLIFKIKFNEGLVLFTFSILFFKNMVYAPEFQRFLFSLFLLSFDHIIFSHVYMELNWMANKLSKEATRLQQWIWQIKVIKEIGSYGYYHRPYHEI